MPIDRSMLSIDVMSLSLYKNKIMLVKKSEHIHLMSLRKHLMIHNKTGIELKQKITDIAHVISWILKILSKQFLNWMSLKCKSRIF